MSVPLRAIVNRPDVEPMAWRYTDLRQFRDKPKKSAIDRLRLAPWQSSDFRLDARMGHRQPHMVSVRWSLAHSSRQTGIIGYWHEDCFVRKIAEVLKELACLRTKRSNALKAK